jgi:hypothetical protein
MVLPRTPVRNATDEEEVGEFVEGVDLSLLPPG